MAKLRLDTLKMDRQAQAKGKAALFEARNTDPEESQGFKRRHGSKIAADGAAVNATGLTSRGVRSYLRLDEDFNSGTFSISMSVKLGTLSYAVSGTKTYHTLFSVRDGAADARSTTELPKNSYACFVEQEGTEIKIGFGSVDAAGAYTGAKTALTSNLTAAASGKSYFVTATRGSSTASIRCREVADTGFLAAGSDIEEDSVSGVDTLGANTIVEFLGSEVQGTRGPGIEPVIQNILIYSTDKSAVTIENLTGATTSAKAPRVPDDETGLIHHYRLDSGDTFSDAAIEDVASGGSEPLLHLHPSPPAVLDGALQFGGSSGAFEVPFSSEFLSLFETKIRSVVKENWSIYIRTTLGPTVGVDQEKTLCHFGQLFRLYLKADNKLYADVNASGEVDPTTIETAGTLSAGTEYEIVLQRTSDDQAHLCYNEIGDAATVATESVPQNTYLDLRRQHSFLLGAQEDQACDTYYSGSVTKCAFYPFKVTKDAGKDDAIFYFDFTEGKYEDQSNAITAQRIFHHESTQKPAYTLGGNGFQDGSFIGIGGGIVFADSGPLGYTNYLAKPLAADLHTQQIGHRVIFASGNYTHIADTRQETSRPLGIPEPGTSVHIVPAGEGALDGIYTYGYRYVSRDGTAGPIRRMNPIHTFGAGGSTVQIGLPHTAGESGGDKGERELGTSMGITESETTSVETVTGTSHWLIKDPGTNSEPKLFERPVVGGAATAETSLTTRTLGVDMRASMEFPRGVIAPESVFTRGVSMLDQSDQPGKRFCIADKVPLNPSPRGNFTLQLCFRFANPREDSYDDQTDNNNHQIPLFSLTTPTSGSHSGGKNAPDFMVSLVKSPHNLGVGANLGYRMVAYRKTTAHPKYSDTYGYFPTNIKIRGPSVGGADPAWAQPDPDIAYTDAVHPLWEAGVTNIANPTGSATGEDSGQKTFWLHGNDYMVFAQRAADFLHLSAIDVTGIDMTVPNPITDEIIRTRSFWAKLEGYFTPNADFWDGDGDDRQPRLFFGAGAGWNQNNATLKHTVIRRTPVTSQADGVHLPNATTAGTSREAHHWFPRYTIFYHGRAWYKHHPVRLLFMEGWRRDAALNSFKTQTGSDSGAFSGTETSRGRLSRDISGGDDGLRGHFQNLWDAGRNAALPARTKIWTSTPDVQWVWNQETLLRDTTLTGLRSAYIGGTNGELPGSPEGIREQTSPLFTLCDYAKEFGDKSLKIYATNLFNGAFVADGGLGTTWVAGRRFWRPSTHDWPRRIPLASPTGLAAYQDNAGATVSGEESRFDFSEATWYSFIIEASKDIADPVTNSEVNFRCRDLRIDGHPGAESIFQGYQLTCAEAASPTFTDIVNNAGFIWIGGTTKSINTRTATKMHELRIWDGDRWDPNDTQWHTGQDYVPQTLSARLESVWAPDIAPTTQKNHLLVYCKFQPYDTNERTDLEGNTYGDGDGIVDNYTDIAHYGQWAHYDAGTYRDSREYHFVTADVDALNYVAAGANPGMVVDSSTDPPNYPPGDPAPKLSIPSGPKNSVAGVELFRSRTLALSEPQQGDAALVARMTDSAKGLPLHLLARLGRRDTSFMDSVLDENLGFEVDDSHGFGPPDVVKGVFAWQDQLALISDKRAIYFAEPGPFGWESFPYWLTYQVPVEIAGGDVQAGAELGSGAALVLGRTWAAILTGTPSSPDAISLGGGVGAYDANNLVTHAGSAFAFNGKLWLVAQDGTTTDIGQPIQGSLPAADQGRLSISSSLASLFLLNKSTGEACRFHFPTQQWTIEDRGALDMGDLEAGTDAWVSTQGVYATGDTSRYADFTHTDAPAAATYNCVIPGGGHTSSTVDLDSGTWTAAQITVGTQVTVIQDTAVLGTDVDSDIFASGVVKRVSGGSIVLDLGNDTAGDARTLATLGFSAADQVTVAVGGPLLVDSGPMSAPEDSILMETDANIVAGTGWHIGQLAQERIGDRDDSGSVDFVAVASNSNLPIAGGYRGKHHRVLARNFSYESAQIAELETDIRGEAGG